MRMLSCLIVACSLCIAGVSASVAQPRSKRKPAKAVLTAAQNHYKRASAFQDLGKYEAAAAEYLKAYKLYPHPEFLFNVAEVKRLDDRSEEALGYYKKYLALDPQGRGAASSRIHVAMLETQVSAAKAAKADTARDNAGSTANEPGSKPAGKARQLGGASTDERKSAGSKAARKNAKHRKAGDSETVEPTVGVDPARHRARILRIAGISTAAAGALSLGLGIKFGLDARSIARQVETTNPWDQSLYERGQAKNRNMFIMYGVGTVALAAGGALYYLGRRGGKERASRPSLSVSPAVRPGLAGIVIGGSY